MKNAWLFWSLIALVLALTANLVYTSFGQEPDVYMWTWFGYQFGINYSSYAIMKMVTILAIFGVLMVAQDKNSQNLKENK